MIVAVNDHAEGIIIFLLRRAIAIAIAIGVVHTAAAIATGSALFCLLL